MKQSVLIALVLVLGFGFIVFQVATTAGTAVEWQTDFAKAQNQANQQGKYLLLNFSGSDWCVWCRRLNDEVFSQPEFKTYARQHLVLAVADFPRYQHLPENLKRQNERLKATYGVKGFPTVILFNPKGEFVTQTGYQHGGAAAYVKHLKAFIEK
ncbi:MAG: thioredoxin family protein [Gemmatimonadetes bacterium]|nr:MAG: thioredoxin family protein [Gemmatimonadota bacterium]